MYRSQTRIPTLFALFVLLFGIGGGILLVETSHPLSTSADVTLAPGNLHISNITDEQFSVSWVTAKQAGGYVVYKDQTGPSKTAFDDRDEDGKPKNYATHHVTVKDLKENTVYYFKIISGGVTYDNHGDQYQQATGPKLAAPVSLDPAYGVVLQVDDQPATGAIVYLTVGKSSPLSTLVKGGGTWLIPLNNIRSQDLVSRPAIGNPEILQISVIFDKKASAEATTDTKNDSPVPTINLGKTFDFRNLQGKNPDKLAKKDEQQNVLGTNRSFNKVDLLFPSQDLATTIDNKPMIKGVGIPGKDVTVIIKSNPQTGTVTVGTDGTWSFIPHDPLPPGEHSVSIATVDENGNPVNLTNKFTVLKSGESVLGDSTPSGTIAPTLSLPTLTPVLTPGPTATASPPVTGNITPTFVFFGAGVAFVVLGLKFLLLP